MRTALLISAALLLALGCACSVGVEDADRRFRCAEDADCLPGWVCGPAEERSGARWCGRGFDGVGDIRLDWSEGGGDGPGLDVEVVDPVEEVVEDEVGVDQEVGQEVDQEIGDMEVDVEEETCVPDCVGKECGPDGCGGSCGPGCDDGDPTTADGCYVATGRCVHESVVTEAYQPDGRKLQALHGACGA
jgi:hypothetical protein